jgi:hypothetical protein
MNTSDAYRNIAWMHLRCGDKVCRIDDPRHVGQVASIWNSVTIKVIWIETGWIEFVAANELQIIRVTEE